jgi:hypothetical protein
MTVLCMGYCGKEGTARQATYDNITLCRKDTTCMLDDCSENTDSRSEYAIVGAFPW